MAALTLYLADTSAWHRVVRFPPVPEARNR
jgi:hypothetical protein